MKNPDHLTEILNDLIKINNDRVAGYEKAIDTVNNLEEDIKLMYTEMAAQSKVIINELTDELTRMDAKVENDSTLSGKIYRLWMGIRATFNGHDTNSSLDACEFGEDAAQKAYTTVLLENVGLSTGLRKMIIAQQEYLKASHDRIKKQRDMRL